MKKSGVILLDPSMKKVLVVRGKKFIDKSGNIYPEGIFSFPKGHINEEESYVHCALRELYEETNINVHISRCDPSIILGDGLYFVKFVNFHDIKYKIKDRSEITKISWKNIEDIKQLCCNKSVREFAKRFDSLILTKLNSH